MKRQEAIGLGHPTRRPWRPPRLSYAWLSRHSRCHHRNNSGRPGPCSEWPREYDCPRPGQQRGIIDTIVQRNQFHLDPARDQSEFLARLVRDGDLDPADEPAFTSHLRTALAGMPQIAALAVIRTDLKQLRVERAGDKVIVRSIDMRTVPGLNEAFEMARSAGQPIWGELLWSARLNQPPLTCSPAVA